MTWRIMTTITNVPRGSNIFGFLNTWNTNIDNVRLKESKTVFSCLLAFSEADSRRFFLKFFFWYQSYTQRKILLKCYYQKLSIPYYVHTSSHNNIFSLVKYCYPFQWEKFTDISLISKWNISITRIPQNNKW